MNAGHICEDIPNRKLKNKTLKNLKTTIKFIE